MTGILVGELLRQAPTIDVGTIIGIVVTVIILGIVGLVVYRRIVEVRGYRRPSFGRERMTPEGEPLERPGSFARPGEIPRRIARVIVPAIIGFIVLIVVVSASIKIVEAGYRGVLLEFGAVDTNLSLNEGLHFVTPFKDNVIQLEVRTQRTTENAASASRDLQDVSTQVALNYHVNPETVQVLYKEIGFDYSNRVIQPAIQESVKQVTARFNAEELITRRETVKTEIEEQIKLRLAVYNIVVEAISITEFRFSEQFTRAVEAKVEAEQRALQAENDLRRIQIEAQQVEAAAIGEQRANIARAEGLKQANILEAEGEAEAIQIIDTRLRESPSYLEWLKTQRWDGKLPLVVGEGSTPFISIPTGEEE